jgi:hypothetical protein
MEGRARGHTLVAAALTCALAIAAPAWAEGDITDPHEVLAKHYDAIGGLERLKAQESLHFVADFSVSGLSGTMEHWEVRPDRNRTELDLQVISMTMGDDGTTAWELDPNGKLRIEQDPGALARREAAKRLANYEHLDPDSEAFTVTLDGIETVEDRECYSVRISSTDGSMERVMFVDTSDFLLRESIEIRPDDRQFTVYSDYREVDGVLYAFRSDMEIQPIMQQQTMVTTLLETNVDVDPALFAPPEEAVRDFAFTNGGTSAEVAFQFLERHIFLPVTVGGRQGLWVLDSGASSSVIDREFAESLGLELSGEMLGQGAGNTVDVAFTTLPPFSIDGIDFEEQQVAVIDFVDLFRRIADIEVVGILGYDFLSRFVTKVDYANESLVFYDPAAFEYAGDGVVLDAPLRENLFTVEVTVDDVHTGRWMLDLGAGGMTFHSPYAREHDLRSRPGVYGVGFGAGGRIMHHRSKYESVEFAGFTLAAPRISSAGSDEQVEGAFSGGELIGNLGSTLFRHFVLYLDYERQQVIVEKGDDFDREFPWDKSGLQLWRPEDAVEVLYVSPGTPAEEAGFAEGDVVLTIDGAPVEELGGLLDYRELLRADAGTTYTFGVERSGDSMELELILRDLF